MLLYDVSLYDVKVLYILLVAYEDLGSLNVVPLSLRFLDAPLYNR
jgi:hypothetical protein